MDNPYTITNLWYNCKVNSHIGIYVPVITNMANYARLNIPNYNTITSIPSGHLPSDINTSTAQNWYSAFDNCQNLTSLPDPFYDTNNATDMVYMFFNCHNLTTIPNFNTSKVTSMLQMFGGCDNLTTVPNFDTSNVTSMSHIFYPCYNLTTVPTFDTSNVTDMSKMFKSCSNIKGDLYIESNSVTSALSMFDGCSTYTKNIYCHANTTTYNTIYANMGNNTYNSNWNTYLKTMEDDYAHIRISFTGGFDEPVYKIFRFPTNKIAVFRRNTSGHSGGAASNIDLINIIEVTPYTDYNIAITQDDLNGWISHNGVIWGSSRFTTSTVIQGFRFFKDITNMTPDIVDTI